MSDRRGFVGRDVDVHALKIIRRDHAFPCADSRRPFRASHLAAGGVIGFAVVAVDEDRQARGLDSDSEKEDAAQNEQSAANALHE
jgi:hypothetical protein